MNEKTNTRFRYFTRKTDGTRFRVDLRYDFVEAGENFIWRPIRWRGTSSWLGEFEDCKFFVETDEHGSPLVPTPVGISATEFTGRFEQLMTNTTDEEIVAAFARMGCEVEIIPESEREAEPGKTPKTDATETRSEETMRNFSQIPLPREPSNTLNIKALILKVASCDCLTKTPEVRHHAENCRYRIASELIESRAALAAEVKRLKETLRAIQEACDRHTVPGSTNR